MRVDLCDQQLGADRRTSKPGSPLRSTGALAALSRPDGISAKCERPSRPSMSRMTSRKLAVGLRARRPRPELGLDGRPVDAVHRGIEVRVADDGPGSLERLAALVAPAPVVEVWTPAAAPAAWAWPADTAATAPAIVIAATRAFTRRFT